MGRSGAAQPAISEDQLTDENNFSEEEEALYVAENESDIESDPQAQRQGQNLELGNVTVFRRAPGESPEPEQHAFHPRPAAGWPSQAYIPQDDRTLILFDLNGVLVHHTFNGRTHKHYLRPGAEELLRLVPHYRLGIYSSATQRTVQRAMAKLHEDLVAALPEGEIPPPGGYFEVVLCRDHCVLAKEVGAFRKGGKPWDTVKPLGRYFQDLSQIVLVDDSPHKSLPEEAANMLVMPVWEGPEVESGQNDAALPALIDGLLEALKAAAIINNARKIQDIRPIVGEVTKQLRILYPPPPPASSEDNKTEGKNGAVQDDGVTGPGIIDGLSLTHPAQFGGGKMKNRRSTPPPPPGLPPPPHLLRSATTGTAPSIGAEAIHHHAALYFLVLVRLKETPSIPGASLFDINTLLQRRFMAAYSNLFKNSAKVAVKRLVDAGTLVILENNSTTRTEGTTTNTNTQQQQGGYYHSRGTRYSLKKGVDQPSTEKLMEIEYYAQRHGVSLPTTTTTTTATTDGAGTGNDTSSSNNSKEMEACRDLIVSTVAELSTRPGVSKESLDAAVVEVLQSSPVLQAWFGPHVGRDVSRKVSDTLRRLTQEALDAWCSSGDVEMVGIQAGGTPPSLFHVQVTATKGVKTVENAVFSMQKLVDDAAQDVAAALRQRGVHPVPLPPAGGGGGAAVDGGGKAKKVKGQENPEVLPVFEDRGTLTARAVPMLGGREGGDGTQTAAATANFGKERRKNEEDSFIDLTLTSEEDIDAERPAKKKRKSDTTIAEAAVNTTNTITTAATAATTTATVPPVLNDDEVVLTRGQQKLAAMRAKLGLPQDCGLTRAELKELVKEANREKQRIRDLEIQAAKAAKQRGAALMAPPVLSGAAAGAPVGDASGKKNDSNANRKQVQLTPLHLEIAELAKQATPTPSEIAAVQAAVHAVNSAARGVWPAARAVLFGSQATGLALPGGDLDIVVLGVGPQLQKAATGFTAAQRRVLGEHLEDLLDALRRSGTLLTSVQIIDAKIPIIKCLIQTSRTGPALPADISFGAINGAAAVNFLRRQILAVPPLRPLSLAVKAFLRDKGLNEVFTGGIGSYAVVNMVLAHLQREGFEGDLTQADRLGVSRASLLNGSGGAAAGKVSVIDGRIVIEREPQQQESSIAAFDDQETFKYLGQLAAASSGVGGGGGSQTTNNDSSTSYDYGMLLWGFLERFSHEFDFLRQAISIRQGGFVKKGKWKQARRPWLLAVEDPQEPGKDICSGSFNINYVRDEFAAAAQILAEVSEDAEANQLALRGGGGSGSGSSGRGAACGRKSTHTDTITDKMPMLSLLMDIECAVGRTPAANAARRALEHRAEEARQIVKSRFQGSNTITYSQKRSASAFNGSDSRKNKKLKLAPNQSYGFHQPSSSFSPASAFLPFFPPGQQQQQRKSSPKGSTRGGRARGSKGSRAVEAQWKDRRGQFLDYGDDGPDYRGGGSGGGSGSGRQESMQLQKFKGDRWSTKNSNQKGNGGNRNRASGEQEKKKKGIKRKSKGAASPGSARGNAKADLGPQKVKTKRKAKKRSTPATGGGSNGGNGGKRGDKSKTGAGGKK